MSYNTFINESGIIKKNVKIIPLVFVHNPNSDRCRDTEDS